MTSKADYLKKYLGGPTGLTDDYKKPKNKKSKSIKRSTNVCIIDDDVEVKMAPNSSISLVNEDEMLEENLPVIDEESVKLMKQKIKAETVWKTVGVKDEPTEDNDGRIKKKSGLQSAKELQKELKLLRKQEMEEFSKLSDDVTGANAATVDRKRKKNETEEKQKQKRQEEKQEKYDKWSKGIKQQENHEQLVAETQLEMEKPLVRLKDDDQLESMLKSQVHQDDPMADYIKTKKSKKKSSASQNKVYTGPAGPPNRFNIPPGYRWDGVNRSNGFENKYFSAISNKRSIVTDSYKWSVEDM